MEKKHNKKKWMIVLILLLIVVSIGIYWYYNDKTPLNPNLDEQAVDWDGKQKLENAGKGSGGTISIPCFESLVFKANQTTQKVNLYNPENNNVYFVVTLIVGEETIYKSEMIAPNTGFYEIELEKELAAGDYAGTIVYECYSLSNLSPTNGGSFHFDLTVK